LTSHSYAAALMCSHADRDTLMTIQAPWSAFAVLVPNGMLTVADEFEYDRLFVWTAPGRAMLAGRDLKGSGGKGSLFMLSAATLPEVLFVEADPESVEGAQRDAIARAASMAQRLVAGLLLSLQDPANFKERTVAARSGHPGRNDKEPAHRIITIGRPMRVNVRAAVADYIERGSRKGAGPPALQTLVRGHYRRQAVGPGRLDRKVILIEPYWRGPEDAPILSRPKRIEGPR
jgi:hypothetical protein